MTSQPAMDVGATAASLEPAQWDRSRDRWDRLRYKTMSTRTLMSPVLSGSNDPWVAAMLEHKRRARRDASATQQDPHQTSWHSRKTRRMEALRLGRDRNGHGWVSWQIPLAFLFSLMGATWCLSGSLDSFGGITICEVKDRTGGHTGIQKIECDTHLFEALVAMNRTDALNRTEALDGTDGSHPGSINAGFLVLSVIGTLSVVVTANGVLEHAELHHSTDNVARDNAGSLVKFAVVLVLQLVSLLLCTVIGTRAPTAFSRLEDLHRQGEVSNSNFDPDTAAAYAYAGKWCMYLSLGLMFFPAMGQYRRLFGIGSRRRNHLAMLNREKSKAPEPLAKGRGSEPGRTEDGAAGADASVLFPVEAQTIRRRKRQVKWFGAAWLYLVAVSD